LIAVAPIERRVFKPRLGRENSPGIQRQGMERPSHDQTAEQPE
jgi:hypothetical protein